MSDPTRPLHVLLIEDSRRQYLSLHTELTEGNWHVIRAADAHFARDAVKQAREARNPIDAVAIDLGLPPIKDDPFSVGIPLAQHLRLDRGLPVLAYTSLPPDFVDYGEIVARLLPAGISFVSLRTLADEVDLSLLLRLVWRGFVLLSPVTATFLPSALPEEPDPLEAKEWRILELLASGHTQKEIGEVVGFTRDHIKGLLRTIADKLYDRGEMDVVGVRRDELARWYNEHYVRYRR